MGTNVSTRRIITGIARHVAPQMNNEKLTMKNVSYCIYFVIYSHYQFFIFHFEFFTRAALPRAAAPSELNNCVQPFAFASLGPFVLGNCLPITLSPELSSAVLVKLLKNRFTLSSLRFATLRANRSAAILIRCAFTRFFSRSLERR